MPESSHTGEAIGALKPRDLVAMLDRIDVADVAASNIDVDAIGRAIDPRKLGTHDLTSVLAAVNRLAEAGADIGLSRMGPTTFARLMAHATTDQVEAIMVDPVLRERVLGEIFRRMGAHLRQDRVKDLHAVVHWRLTGGSGEGGFDRYETVFRGGTCAVGREMAEKPRVTVTLTPVDFLKLISNNASAPVLFMTGKLKVRGDLAFAANLIGLFDLPRP
ncbi:SCP2 sterol-binding domain-containing protein [Actinokineospora spheciospongiae]|uniref:SCP2 sterol-binding domain-containing protein n=1 Tax=Actinokineospora spheciospongiae TaxID=909613 RepID=UPI000D717B64|nr:SCP2 sterol-binding domain-containing protein [Actinokineospora spheciospongiae]PWW61856.1 SCP-2 sterol transfer family protein [Actinokineospora spheciospongiae]